MYEQTDGQRWAWQQLSDEALENVSGGAGDGDKKPNAGTEILGGTGDGCNRPHANSPRLSPNPCHR
jgi:hypothetical protein